MIVNIASGLTAGQTVNINVDVAFPHLERAIGLPLMPIDTPRNTGATRPAENVTVDLPTGTHDVEVAMSNGGVRRFQRATGRFALPADINGIVTEISAKLAA